MTLAYNANAQSPKELLTTIEWKNIFGNTFEISEDTIKTEIRNLVLPRNNSIQPTSIITDSSFLHYIVHNEKRDTLLYFSYKVNTDSLVMKYFQYESDSPFNDTYKNMYAAYFLMHRTLPYYSPSYLQRSNRVFKLKSIFNKGINKLDYKINSDGTFKFHISDSNGGVVGRSDYRTILPLKGQYTGKVSDSTLIRFNAFLNSKQGLRSYQFATKKVPEIDSTWRLDYVFVEGETEIVRLISYDFGRLIIDELFFSNSEINWINPETKVEEPVHVVRKSRILPIYAENSRNGNAAISGQLTFVKTIRHSDSINYLYKVKIDSLRSFNSSNLKVGQVAYFISGHKITNKRTGIVYHKKYASYHTLNWKSKTIEYNFIDTTFTPEKHIIFEYKSPPYKNTPLVKSMAPRYNYNPKRYGLFDPIFRRNEEKQLNHFYSEMDYKIIKALKKFE